MGTECVWTLGKREPSWKPWGPARQKGKGPAVGSRQRRRRDIATWPLVQEMDSPRLQETVMHRVSAFVHCTAVIQYNHNRNRVSLYYLFQENKSFGTYYHLHSSSDVQEVVSSTVPTTHVSHSNPPLLAGQLNTSVQVKNMATLHHIYSHSHLSTVHNMYITIHSFLQQSRSERKIKKIVNYVLYFISFHFNSIRRSFHLK
jgi:hypothetical protein